MPGQGSCNCGEIRYEFQGEASEGTLCHCIDCQKSSGGAYSSNIIVDRANFTITKGTPKVYKATADSGKLSKRSFCGNCGSPIYTEAEVAPDKIILKTSGLDNGGRNLTKIAAELYVKDRVPYLKGIDGAAQDQAWELTNSA